MSKIISVERSQFLKDNISIYTGNRVGQYAKYLERNPIFVTYYHTNAIHSTQDVGTGGIESELGGNSPIRFNKILNFPMFNIPELKPDLVYDESGYDIDLEFSDVAILPGTIRPRGGDYFVVSIPNAKQYLFRVNNFHYNTIQSNDYYTVDCDVKYIGDNAERDRMNGQIIDEYLTIFDNIGTQEKCFIRSSDIDYINNVASLNDMLIEFYTSAFYVRDLNSFTYIEPNKWAPGGYPVYRYDPFLESFINKSNIYYKPGDEQTLVLTPASVLQPNFNFVFQQTLYYALLNRSIDFLKPYCLSVISPVLYKYSIYNMMGYSAEMVNLFCYKDLPESMKGECNIEPQWYDIAPLPKEVPTWTLCENSQYISTEFLHQIINDELNTDDYFQLLIFNFLHGKKSTIEKKEILNKLEKNSYTFQYLPIIIYILESLYNDYFKTESESADAYPWM